MNEAARSPMAMAVRLVGARVMRGMIDASATRRFFDAVHLELVTHDRVPAVGRPHAAGAHRVVPRRHHRPDVRRHRLVVGQIAREEQPVAHEIRQGVMPGHGGTPSHTVDQAHHVARISEEVQVDARGHAPGSAEVSHTRPRDSGWCTPHVKTTVESTPSKAWKSGDPCRSQ